MTATESKNGHNGHNGHTSAHNGGAAAPTDPEALRQEIARTRVELGETVEALAAKADVKARAQEAVSTSVTAAKLRMREGVEQVAVNAAYAGRELRTHPRQTVERTLQRMVRSVRERPAPWVVASGLLVLVALVGYRKGHE